MNVIKFLYMRPAGYGKGYTDSGSVDLVFDICPELAKRLLRHTRCPSYRLFTILDEGYNYYYRFILERDGHDRERITYFIKKVEQISNEKGKIPLEVFVNDYHLIMLKDQIEEIRSEQMFSSASLNN